MKQIFPPRAIALGLLIGISVLGCAPQRVTTLSHPRLKQAEVLKIGVLPFITGRHPTNVQDTLVSNLNYLSFDPQSVVIGADSTLTRYVHEALETRFGARVIPMSFLMEAYERTSKNEAEETPMSLARKLGEAVGANLMMVGSVWRYRDRVGSSAGTTRPASVAFDVYLVEVRSGEALWMANFDETQRSLSENLLDASAFFRRGAKWLSANELAQYGVQEVIKRFPL